MPAQVRNPAGHWVRTGTLLNTAVAGDSAQVRSLIITEPTQGNSISFSQRVNVAFSDKENTILFDTWNTNPTFYIQGPNLCAIDQDVRAGASGVEFVDLTVVTFETGDFVASGNATDGSPVVDVDGKTGATGFGANGQDGQGVDLNTGNGGDSYGGNAGNGGDITIVLGSKASTGGGSPRDGQLIITSLPTSDPSVSGALWNDSGTVKVSP